MKKKRPPKKQPQSKPAAQSNISSQKNIAASHKVIPAIIITVIAFLLYAPGIQHNYALDDSAVIQENSVTTQGFAAIPIILKTDYWYGSGHSISRGPIYRPTSLVIFAIAWDLFPDNPHVYHFINVSLFAVTCLILFLVLCQLFKNQNILFPFVCALLYAAHPIHTEVVDNIKSLDEILCFLFAILSIWLLLKFVESSSKLSLVLGGVGFFLSLLSKETGITFLVLIPVTIFVFTDAPLKKIITLFVALVIFTGIWLFIRSIVFKDLPLSSSTTGVLNNALNAAPDNASKYATIFYVLLRYVLLMIFPHPLSYDYSYAQIKIRTPGDPAALAGIVLIVGATIYALFRIPKKDILAFGILFFLIALSPVSNLFFMTASTMGERFLYIPSFGFCLIVTYLLIVVTKADTRKQRADNFFRLAVANGPLFLAMLAIWVLCSYKIVSRDKDWKDSLTLFSHDVKVAGNSARTNQNVGSALMLAVMKSPNKHGQADTFTLAKNYLKRALEIYPEFYAPLSHLGVIYIFENKFDSAYDYLKRGVAIMPDDVDLNFNLGLALFHLQKNDSAIKVLTRTVQLSPAHENAYYNLGALYQNKGSLDSALSNYAKVIQINPNNAGAYYNSGAIYKSRGDTAKGNQFIRKAESLGYRP
jgi:tetratricopeptide (TPR) repeat protein